MPIPLVAVELSFDADFELRPADADVLVQLRGGDVMWQKERLLNIALGALPAGCRKVVWLDCDVIVGSEDWPQRVGKALDDSPVVQPFSRMAHLTSIGQMGIDFTPTEVELWRSGVAFPIANGESLQSGLAHDKPHAQMCATGIAWAARRDLLDRHGLYDACIIGNGNHAINCAAYGCFDMVIRHQAMNAQQRKHYLAWAEPFYQAVRGSVSFVDGSIFHLWHGTVSDRRYRERLLGLQRFEFDPYHDIAMAENGVWRWNSDKPLLHQYVRDYFASRKEDG